MQDKGQTLAVVCGFDACGVQSGYSHGASLGGTNLYEVNTLQINALRFATEAVQRLSEEASCQESEEEK